MKSMKYLVLLLCICLSINCSNDDNGVVVPMLSNEKKITSFLFDASLNNALSNDVPGTINESAKTISVTVPYGTDITALTPSVQISEKASINTSGTQNFSNEVIYRVTAEDDSTVDYNVLVMDEANDQKAIITFQFLANDNGLAQDIPSILNEETKTITIHVPNNTDITNLLPTIDASPEATYAPTGFQDFSNPIDYVATAEDGSTATYQATVIPVVISSFRFVRFNEIAGEIVIGEGTIYNNTSEIEVIVSESTDVTDLPVPGLETLEDISFSPVGQKNFAFPVNYTLTAPNGVSVTYEVIVRKAFKSITSFRFNKSQNPALASDVIGTINEQQRTIGVVLPGGTNPNVRNNLTPSILVTTGSNATVSPSGAQNFSNAVEYIVTGLDGSTKIYTVAVIISP